MDVRGMHWLGLRVQVVEPISDRSSLPGIAIKFTLDDAFHTRRLANHDSELSWCPFC